MTSLLFSTELEVEETVSFSSQLHFSQSEHKKLGKKWKLICQFYFLHSVYIYYLHILIMYPARYLYVSPGLEKFDLPYGMSFLSYIQFTQCFHTSSISWVINVTTAILSTLTEISNSNHRKDTVTLEDIISTGHNKD